MPLASAGYSARLPPVDDELPDYYATLGLDRGCTLAQIRAAYRLLAKRLHPDRNAGSLEAEERTRTLNEAHDCLSDAGRRRAYDRDLGGRNLEPEPRSRGKLERNIAHDVHLRIEELLRGISLEFTVNDPANVEGPETYQLAVPPETAPGTRFRLPRVGTFDGGVVQVRVKVRPGARFKPRGSDLRCDLRINARRAAQGGTETLPGPAGGTVRVAVPPGVGRGEIIRVLGEGLPKARGGRGDLLVKITYRPEVLTSRAGRW